MGLSLLVADNFGRRQGSMYGEKERRKYKEKLGVRKWATIMGFR